MDIFLYILAAVGPFLITGINPAIVLSRLVYKQDIRECGSGNPGFTNFKRTFGGKWAWWVLLLDLLKGAVSVAVFAGLLSVLNVASFPFGTAYTGMFALLGHAYPVWHGLKGGKGFLVYMSVIWLIDWRAGLVALGIMMLLLFTTKYMSLSTVTAMLSCPITLILVRADMHVICFCAVSVLYIAARHKENFKRLVAGTENKFSLRKKAS